MAIRRGKYNHWNDNTKDFDVIHHETRIGQVMKMDSNGNITGTLEDVLADKSAETKAVDTKVGDLNSLTTTAKGNIVSAVNEVKANATTNANEITKTNSNVTALTNRVATNEGDIKTLKAHNHDDKYLALSGGTMTGSITMRNNLSYSMKNSSNGADLNIGKVDGSTQVILGDATATRTIIGANGGDLQVNTGSANHKVFHTGNMGAGSGLDADRLDGLDSTAFAILNTTPNFTNGVNVNEGKNIVLKAKSGSVDSGDLVFQDGSGNKLGSIEAGTNGAGTLYFRSKSTTVFEMRSGGAWTRYPINLSSQDRQAQIQFRRNDNDLGCHFYLSSQDNFGLWNARTGISVFRLDWTKNILNMTNGLMIQGKRVWIQSGTPSGTHANGDIWFKI